MTSSQPPGPTLDANTALLSAVFEALPDPIFVKNSDHQWIYGNHAFRMLLGIDDFCGKDDTDLGFSEEQIQVFWTEDDKVINGTPSVNEEKIGDSLTALTKKMPIILPDGSRGLVGIIFDVTEYRGAQIEAERLRAANDARATFIAHTNHEIRTPLNGILGMAQSLAGDDLPPAQSEKVGVIVESGKTLMTILNDVLDLAKIDSGKMEITPIPTDVRHALRRVGKLFSTRAEEKGLDLRIETDHALPPLLALDPVRFRQCVANMVSNAIKFTAAGGVYVTAQARRCRDGDWRLSVTVKDTGIGIAEGTMGKLFSEFSQADSSTTRQYGGTGLGLVITRKLARLMGGDLTVKSASDVGSSFTLTLRAPESEVPGGHDRDTGTVAQLSVMKGRRLLIVDDNAVNRQVARLLLDHLDINIAEAADGKAALEKLAAEDFDLVLLDIHMPVMDGIETISRIRGSDAPWADIPVIALTADAMRGDREKLIAIGMNGYAAKPINQPTLLTEMIRVLTATAYRPRAASPAGVVEAMPGDQTGERLDSPHASGHDGPLSQLSDTARAELKATWAASVTERTLALLDGLAAGDPQAIEAADVFRAAHDCVAQSRLFGLGLLGEIATNLCVRLRGRTGALSADERAFAIENLRNMAAAVAEPAAATEDADENPIRQSA